MKNLINAVTNEQKKRLEDFITSINNVKSIDELTAKYGFYSDLIPRGKDVNKMNFEALKAYLITRKEKAIYKSIEREVNNIKNVMDAGKLIEVKISIEWKRSQMWGSNPSAEAWCSYIDRTGSRNSHYVKSGSIGGCGYDKQSTAVAECLNQFKEVLKPLYQIKDAAPERKNNEVFGYGSGYGILPNIEGGVGVSCYNEIFEKVGYKFSSVASGKSFDVFTITSL